MTQQECFNRSVAVLETAFLKGRLNEYDCAACACGNLVAAANNFSIVGFNRWEDKSGKPVRPDWVGSGWQVQSTGYTSRQFGRIETAFMSALITDHHNKDARDFAGLMAVVDVLADIHGIDLAAAAAAKTLFVKEPA